VGGVEQRLPQRDCYVNVLRDAMAVDSLDTCGCTLARRAGRCMRRPTLEIAGRPLCAICRLCSRLKCRLCHDRVLLPAHLRTLAQVSGEVKVKVEGPVTQRSVLDAIEACYPMLRGTSVIM